MLKYPNLSYDHIDELSLIRMDLDSLQKYCKENENSLLRMLVAMFLMQGS